MSIGELNRYRCLARQRFERGDYSVSPVQPEHIETIRVWRNAQIGVLRQKAPIQPDEQARYYADHVWPNMAVLRPATLLMIYSRRSRVIGYGGLVHIAWDDLRAEVSFLVDPDRTVNPVQYATDFSTFLGLMRDVAFGALGLHRLFTETYANRTHHIEVLESAGFRREGTMRHHVMLGGAPTDSLLHGCLATDPPLLDGP